MKSFPLFLLIFFSIIPSSFGQHEINPNLLSTLNHNYRISQIGRDNFDYSTSMSVQKLFRMSALENINKYKYQNFSLNQSVYPKDKNETAASTLPIAIGALAFFYLLNPILLFENDKIAGGITKELSLGFGYFGEHRLSFEYSYLFRADLKSHLRLGYKYDLLLEKGLKPSNSLQGTTVISLGAGYFTDLRNHGFFPEVSYGYSIRNHKFLFYPNLKLRYTYVTGGSNIIDFSFGIIIGIANPFIDLKIRKANN